MRKRTTLCYTQQQGYIGHGTRDQSDSRILEETERLSFGKGGSDELEDLITQITSRAMTWSEVRKPVITRPQSQKTSSHGIESNPKPIVASGHFILHSRLRPLFLHGGRTPRTHVLPQNEWWRKPVNASPQDAAISTCHIPPPCYRRCPLSARPRRIQLRPRPTTRCQSTPCPDIGRGCTDHTRPSLADTGIRMVAVLVAVAIVGEAEIRG